MRKQRLESLAEEFRQAGGNPPAQYKSAVVAGWCGYIGWSAARELRQAGYDVLGVDREVPPRGPDHSFPPGAGAFSIYRADMCSAYMWNEILDRTPGDEAVIVNCAGFAAIEGAERDAYGAWRDNVGVVHALSGALMSRADRHRFRVVHMSSATVYGNSFLAGEPDKGNGTVHSVYATTKDCAETVLARHLPRQAVSLRLGSVTGVDPQRPESRAPGFVPRGVLGAYLRCREAGERFSVRGGWGTLRSYVDIRDVARAVLWAADSPLHRPVNIAGPVDGDGRDCALTLRDVAETVERQAGPVRGSASGFRCEPVALPGHEQSSLRLDTGRARKHGFRAKYGFADSVSETLDARGYFRSPSTLGTNKR